MRVLATLLLVAVSCYGQLWSGIITAPRAVDWSNVGIPGGIPSGSWATCTTLNSGTTVSAINSAIAACGSNQCVALSAGSYSLSGTITFIGHSDRCLRGAGPNSTLITFSSVTNCQGFTAAFCMSSTDLNYVFAQSNLVNWTANYSAGTTSITLDAKTNMFVGSVVVLDQLDDTVDSGDLFVCYTAPGPPVCSTNGDNGGFARSGRGQQQVVTITSISAGSCPCTIGVDPPIYMPNWASGKSPQAWYATSPVGHLGLENLSYDMTAAEPTVGTGTGVQMLNCGDCWVTNVRSISPGRSHVQMQIAARPMVTNSYFFKTAAQTSTSYGVESAGTGDALIQNNIFQQITEPMSLNGTCSGCVEGYNFDIDDVFDSGGGVYTFRIASSLPHAVGVDHVLVEGNQGSGFQADVIHGSHSFITTFRNQWNGYQKNNGNNPTNNNVPIIMNALNRFFNLIGNVLGSPLLMTQSIYQIGNSETGTYTVPSDSNVGRTLMRWGNYDTQSAAVSWASGDVPSGISVYPNSLPASMTLPASFYLSSKPSWWPGSKAWPPIGPDVTGGNISGLGGFANTIPAQDCYTNVMGGSADGTGSVLSFNPASCYSGASSSTGGSSRGGSLVSGGAIAGN